MHNLYFFSFIICILNVFNIFFPFLRNINLMITEYLGIVIENALEYMTTTMSLNVGTYYVAVKAIRPSCFGVSPTHQHATNSYNLVVQTGPRIFILITLPNLPHNSINLWKFKNVYKYLWTFRPPKLQLNQFKQYVKQLVCGNLTNAIIWNW